MSKRQRNHTGKAWKRRRLDHTAATSRDETPRSTPLRSSYQTIIQHLGEPLKGVSWQPQTFEVGYNNRDSDGDYLDSPSDIGNKLHAITQYSQFLGDSQDLLHLRLYFTDPHYKELHCKKDAENISKEGRNVENR